MLYGGRASEYARLKRDDDQTYGCEVGGVGRSSAVLTRDVSGAALRF